MTCLNTSAWATLKSNHPPPPPQYLSSLSFSPSPSPESPLDKYVVGFTLLFNHFFYLFNCFFLCWHLTEVLFYLITSNSIVYITISQLQGNEWDVLPLEICLFTIHSHSLNFNTSTAFANVAYPRPCPSYSSKSETAVLNPNHCIVVVQNRTA